MIYFVGYLLAAFGFAFVVGYSEITLSTREGFSRCGILCRWIVRLMECPACLGWHTGWAYALAARPEFIPGGAHGIVLLAFLTCGSNLVLGRLTGLIKP